ncbi:unnamed protein product [Trichobilharzia szidati]|nr:unnamed protein product [Trichobilharzia szidati]
MGDEKAAMNSRIRNREFPELDKFSKRVLVFLLAVCSITLVVTLCMTFISMTEYLMVTALSYVVLAVVDVAVVYVLVVSARIRKQFPLNLLLTMLHSACLTVLAEVAFIGRKIIWVLFVLALAVAIYTTCITMGARLKRELHVGTVRMLIGYIIFSVVIAAVTLAVYSSTQYFALYIGQITIGQLEFRAFDPDYCTAAMILHATFIIFLIALGIGFIRPRNVPMMSDLIELSL